MVTLYAAILGEYNSIHIRGVVTGQGNLSTFYNGLVLHNFGHILVADLVAHFRGVASGGGG